MEEEGIRRRSKIRSGTAPERIGTAVSGVLLFILVQKKKEVWQSNGAGGLQYLEVEEEEDWLSNFRSAPCCSRVKSECTNK